MPRPGSHVIHPDWETHHAPVAEGTQTASCVIRGRAGTPVFDPNTGLSTSPVGAVHYTGMCRIQRLDDQPATQAEDRVVIRQYLVTIARDAAAVVVGDIGTVIESNDPLLTTFKVERVLRGTLRFERDLYCTAIDD
jgi:hypothetical protein